MLTTELQKEQECTPVGPAGPTVPQKLRPLVAYLEGLDGPADLEALRRILEQLELSRADLEEACQFDEGSFRRNPLLVTKECQLLLLCWRPGQRSSIHDHGGSACAFKVVEGTATEVRFRRVEGTDLVRRDTLSRLGSGTVCCAADADIHQVANHGGPGEDLITLHLYSPPLRMNVYRELADSGAADAS
jgi:cysteine dioxygenase